MNKKPIWRKAVGRYLQDAGDDGAHVGREPVSKGQGQVDEHHDVAVPHVGGDVHLAGRVHHVGHQLVQLLHSQASHHLRQTWDRQRGELRVSHP